MELDKNTVYWINYNIKNKLPLRWSQFVNATARSGVGLNIIVKYKSKKYRYLVQRAFNNGVQLDTELSENIKILTRRLGHYWK